MQSFTSFICMLKNVFKGVHNLCRLCCNPHALLVGLQAGASQMRYKESQQRFRQVRLTAGQTYELRVKQSSEDRPPACIDSHFTGPLILRHAEWDAAHTMGTYIQSTEVVM